MTYTIQSPTGLNVSWETKDEYVYSSSDFVNAYFLIPDERGNLTGFAPVGTRIIAYPRNEHGLVYTKKYETITSNMGIFSIRVPYKGIEYAIFCLSPESNKNTLCRDWKIAT